MLKNPYHDQMCLLIAQGWTVKKAAFKVGIFSEKFAYDLIAQPEYQECIAAYRQDATVHMNRVMEAGEVHSSVRRRFSAHDISRIYDEIGAIRPIHDWPEGYAERLKKIEYGETGAIVKVEFESAQKDIEIAARLTGAYVDKLELSGPGGGPVQTINSEMSVEDAAELYATMIGKR